MQKLLLVLISLNLIILTSCDNSVHRVDPTNTENEVNTRFDIKDSDIFIKKMVGSLANHRLAQSNPPAKIRVVRVENKTSEHIDTKEMTLSISKYLLQLGCFRVVSDVSDVGDVIEENEYADSGYGNVRDPNKGEQFADLLLRGQLIEISKRGGGVQDRTFKFTLELVNRQNEKLWIEDEIVRKQQARATVGW